MKISALRLFNVKRFAGRGVAIEGIGDGVNVLCAANEFGKSTSFEALHALFFQPHSSTAGDVRSLRPYSGGNPLVEADISTAEGTFRITKQFYGRGSARVVDLANGRLVAQADEAEDFIAGLVRGGTAGPAGLLWVRQGVTGIEKRSRSEEEGETKVRTSLLQSVQGEVEAVTGGRRMSEIMAATEEALGRLVTPTGRAKAGERYAASIEERDRLEAKEQRLAAEVGTLREALDRRAAATTAKVSGELATAAEPVAAGAFSVLPAPPKASTSMRGDMSGADVSTSGTMAGDASGGAVGTTAPAASRHCPDHGMLRRVRYAPFLRSPLHRRMRLSAVPR